MSVLHDYFQLIRESIAALSDVHIEQHREELLTTSRANLRIRLRLSDNSLLEISESLVVEAGALNWIGYRYHWQDASGRLILRHDDAPHHPEIESFPHHKHIEQMIIASKRPALPDLLAEIQRLLTKP